MTAAALSETEQVDQLVRWMAEQKATAAEIVDVLAQAGLRRSRATIHNRARALGVALSKVNDPAPLPMAMSMFPRFTTAQRDALEELAIMADRSGLTLEEYEHAKARILREGR